MRAPYLVGNWKMNQSLSDIDDFFNFLDKDHDYKKVRLGVAPQALHLGKCLEKVLRTGFELGTQNCSEHNNGAFTGELSIDSIKDMGLQFSLVGHSERRSLYGEDDHLLNKKFKKCFDKGLKVIFCIGETLEQRKAGETNAVLEKQLRIGLEGVNGDVSDKLVIAYEPVWAIGTGVSASPEEAEEAHQFIRGFLGDHFKLNADNIHILYGGSVKPANVVELLNRPNIDGALIGGASLTGESFFEMAKKALSN